MKSKYLNEEVFSRKQIENSIKEVAKWANKEFKGNRNPVIVIGVLDGSVPFFGQLLTKLKFNLITDFIRLSSFDGKEEREHDPVLTTDLQEKTKSMIKNKVVFVVDDVISTGKTAVAIYKQLMDLGAKEVKFAFLLDQKNEKISNISFTYHAALEVENKFLVGYGLDYQGKYRNLDQIGILKDKYKK